MSPVAPLVGADDIAGAWDELPLGERRAILSALVTVNVLPAGRGSRAGIEARLSIAVPEKLGR